MLEGRKLKCWKVETPTPSSGEIVRPVKPFGMQKAQHASFLGWPSLSVGCLERHIYCQDRIRCLDSSGWGTARLSPSSKDNVTNPTRKNGEWGTPTVPCLYVRATRPVGPYRWLAERSVWLGRPKLIHRESFRASVLHHSDTNAVLQSMAAKRCLLTTPSLLSMRHPALDTAHFVRHVPEFPSFTVIGCCLGNRLPPSFPEERLRHSSR